jgi:hypothetical protein
VTVTVSDNVADITGGKDARPWKVWSPVVREGDDGVVSLRQRTVDVTDGVFTAELEPGLAVIESPDGVRWSVTVPDYDISLSDLIAISGVTPDTGVDLLYEAVSAYLTANPDVAELVGAVSDFDARLDDTRTPTDASVTLAKLTADLAAALAYLSAASAAGVTVLRLGRNVADDAQATQVEVWVDGDESGSVRVARWNSSGEYISGNLQIGGDTDANTRAVRVNAAAGQSRALSFQTGGVDRWLLIATTDAESGSDAGSNLSIRSRTDAGGAKTTVVSIDRQTGIITLGGELTTLASTTTRAGLNIPAGTAPTSPADGDVWTTTTDAFVRLNGVTRRVSTKVAAVARTSQFSLSNSTTETDVISMTLTPGVLVAGTTFRIRVAGSVRNAASSGTLTFKVYIGTNAAPQTFIGMPNNAGSSGYKDLGAEFDVTVRTTGGSGTFAAGGSGLCTISGWNSIASTTTGTSVVDTTASSPVVKLTAQWANADSLNVLLLETATIEQVV